MQIVGGRKSDRMQQEVQLTPFSADPRESLLQLAGNTHITYQQQFAAEGIGDSVDIRPRLVVQIGCSDFSTRRNEGTRTTGSNAGVIRNANDEAAFTLQAGRDGRLHDASSWRVTARLIVARVWRAIMSSSSVAMTRTSTLLSGVLMRPAFAAFAVSSMRRPSQLRRAHTAARMAGA